jgi:hypothetical protein
MHALTLALRSRAATNEIKSLTAENNTGDYVYSS